MIMVVGAERMGLAVGTEVEVAEAEVILVKALYLLVSGEGGRGCLKVLHGAEAMEGASAEVEEEDISIAQ
jgi:hypothetical protein